MYSRRTEGKAATSAFRTRRGDLSDLFLRLPVTVVLACAVLAGAAGVSYGWLGLKYNGVRCYWPAFKNHSTVGWTDKAGEPAYTAFVNAVGEWNSTATWVDMTGGASSIVTDNPNLGNTGDDGITYYSCQSSGVFDQPVKSDLNSYYTVNYTTNERLSVAAHEIGHSAASLQAENPSGCTLPAIEIEATSQRYGECGIYKPQDDDIDGTNALYPYP